MLINLLIEVQTKLLAAGLIKMWRTTHLATQGRPPLLVLSYQYREVMIHDQRPFFGGLKKHKRVETEVGRFRSL